MVNLTELPNEILISLPSYIHDIEDFTSITSTCRILRDTCQEASPNTILRLCAAKSTTFFRPSPHLLIAATARQLGSWARQSTANETLLATTCQEGIDALLPLCVAHCGLTLPRIRALYELRFSTINPVTNIIDQCVGAQWYSTPNFWNGGVDDAYTVSADPSLTFFHLAIYGELFGPDFDAWLDPTAKGRKTLSVETRLEFIKYCLPDFATELNGHISPQQARSVGGTLDPRRAVKKTGPYAPKPAGEVDLRSQTDDHNHNLALVWVLKSTKWRPHWNELRKLTGEDFGPGLGEDGWYDDDDEIDWRQKIWENVMLCQGLDGIGMMLPEQRGAWVEKLRRWRDQIAAMDSEPEKVKVGLWNTSKCPWLLGDLRICTSGYVGGT
ncbi:Hypothetical protein D9617_6g092670 [Elsinoe fawcettii]|nr:Hypothetical protein D9617_6g092670 [Elsinoe fawcettii]